REDDFKQPTVKEALRESINLAFIRIMRDVAYHFIYRGPDSSGKVLQDPRHPDRTAYLSRFADHEGRVFMRHFYRKYQGLARDEILPEFLDNIRPAPHRYAVIYRTVVPEGNLQQFAKFMRAQFPGSTMTDGDLAALYEKYGIDKFSLQDRGYLARVHPL